LKRPSPSPPLTSTKTPTCGSKLSPTVERWIARADYYPS
jgi:hypothetical protein